jgi:hypothetical protein
MEIDQIEKIRAFTSGEIIRGLGETGNLWHPVFDAGG